MYRAGISLGILRLIRSFLQQRTCSDRDLWSTARFAAAVQHLRQQHPYRPARQPSDMRG